MRLKSSHLRTVNGVQCGKVKGVWTPGKRLRNRYFIAHTRQATNYRALAKRRKGSARRNALRAATWYSTQAKKQRATCAGRAPNPIPPSEAKLKFSLKGAVGTVLADSTASQRSRDGARVASVGSNLQALFPDGSLREAITTGTATVRRVVPAPDGSLYVVFSDVTALGAGQACAFVQVYPDSGVPNCVDPEVQPTLTFPPATTNEPIQFDARGRVYYAAAVKTGGLVIRRLGGGPAQDLISRFVSVTAWLVLPSGDVLISGATEANGQRWTRLISSSGGIRTLRNQDAIWIRLFSDGNAYLQPSSWTVDRFLVGSGELDSRPWLGGTNGRLAWSQLCLTNPVVPSRPSDEGEPSRPPARPASRARPPRAQAARVCDGGPPPPVFTPGKPPLATSDGRQILRYGNEFVQIFPELVLLPSAVTVPGVAAEAGNQLVVSGLGSDGRNMTTLLDPAGGNETQLMGPDQEVEIYRLEFSASENRVFFDGLRFADNRYVLGYIDLATREVVVSNVRDGKWGAITLIR